MIGSTRQRDRREWLVFGAALLALAVLIGNWLYAERDQIEGFETERLLAQAHVIDDNLGRNLQAVNRALDSIRDGLLYWDGTRLAVRSSQRLRVLADIMPGVRTLVVTDADGTILASSREQLVGENFARRDYFSVPRAHPDARTLYISPPYRTELDVYAMNLSKIVADRDGKFAGVISATLDPDYFSVLLRSVLYAPDMRAALVHAGGGIILSVPRAGAGENPVASDTLLAQHGDGVMVASDRAGGATRMTAVRTAALAGLHADKPLIVAVSRDLAALQAPWRKQALVYRALYAIIATLTALGLYLMQRQRRGLDRAATRQLRADGLLRHFFELPFVGMAVAALDSKRLLRFNDLLCSSLGYTREEMMDLRWDQLVHPEERERDAAAFARMRAGASDEYMSERRFLRKDGSVLHARIDVKCVRDADGGATYVIATVQDLTESRRMEDEYRSIIRASTDGFWITDTDNRILDVNDSICRMLGYSRQELLHMRIQDIEADENPAEVAATTRRLTESGHAVFAGHHRRKDGSVLDVEVSVQYLVDPQPRFYAFIRDITERKKAERRQAAMDAQLRESQKMEALGTLAGGVAHDFNNIIAAILGNAELALDDLPPGHEAAQGLEEICKAARRARDLVQRILTFGRRDAPERTPISLVPVVEESARLLRSTLPAGVSLNAQCAADAPAVLADANQVQQVLLNLCTNAWQAMEEQGRAGAIEIGLAAHLASAASADTAQWNPAFVPAKLLAGRYACLTVRDNGPGMNTATLARIFEPFFTTKPMGKGTGLGLAVVHGIVQSHGGGIEVESAPGAGATFRVYLPAVDAAVAPAQERVAAGARVHGQGRRILYVDDDEAIVFLMTRLLEREGYRVHGCTEPDKALAAVRARPRDFDLVVTDYNMPGMSGLDVARELKQIRADLPVALASGYITEELRARAPAAGVSELVYKPNTVDDLCAAIARLANALPD